VSAARFRLEVLRRGRSRAPARAEMRRWACAALGRQARNREIAVRLVGASESRRLNARFRGRDRATNVLSFAVAGALPPEGARPLGDLVLCPQVVRREAAAQGKPVRAHWAHLIVHGALHLIGYDHERPADARRMESREVRVLRALGFANPYRSVR